MPSIDHQVYVPADDKIPDGIVHLSAMIRSRNPRRGALRTMQLLKKIKQQFADQVDIHLFGLRFLFPEKNPKKYGKSINSEAPQPQTV